MFIHFNSDWEIACRNAGLHANGQYDQFMGIFITIVTFSIHTTQYRVTAGLVFDNVGYFRFNEADVLISFDFLEEVIDTINRSPSPAS